MRFTTLGQIIFHDNNMSLYQNGKFVGVNSTPKVALPAAKTALPNGGSKLYDNSGKYIGPAKTTTSAPVALPPNSNASTPLFGGKVVGGIAAPVLNAVTGSEQNFGQDIAATIEQNRPDVKEAQGKAYQANAEANHLLDLLIKKRSDLKAEGKDTSSLDKVISDQQKVLGTGGAGDTSRMLPSAALKTNEQIVGDAAGVALDVASAGEYSGIGEDLKALKTGNKAKLLEGSGKIISKTPSIVEGTITGAKKAGGVLSSVATGAGKGIIAATPIAAAYGADQALQNNENLKGVTTGALKGGLTGLAAGGFLGAVSGLAQNLPEITKRLTTPKGDPSEIVGKITQATGADVPAAQRALGSVDTKDIKTFKDGVEVLNKQIEENSGKVDTHLSQSKVTYKPSELETKIPVTSGEPIITNPTKDALDQLEKFYEKTNDAQDLARIKNLQDKFESKGLFPKEINDIAREHGAKLNGYNANGELASGLSKQAAENTRSGVKSTVRSLITDDPTKAIDANTTDLIKTRDMFEEMSTKVQQLENKIKNYTPLQKLGRAGGKAVDLFTGGIGKAFLRSVQGFGNDEGQVLNALELQKNLSKNLDLLRKLDTMTPPEIVQEFQKMLALPAPAPGATAATAVAPNTTPAIPQASVETPINLRGATTMEEKAPIVNYSKTTLPKATKAIESVSLTEKPALQQSVIKDAMRFRSESGFLNYVKSNQAVENKISQAGLSPDAVWQNALNEFRKMGAQNPLAKGKKSFPLPSKYGIGK